jgi:hypothetical protein
MSSRSNKLLYLAASPLTESGTSGSWDITTLARLDVTGTLGILILQVSSLVNPLAVNVCLLKARSMKFSRLIVYKYSRALINSNVAD